MNFLKYSYNNFSCIFWHLQNLKLEVSFEHITIKTIRHIFRNISDRFYYFASSFIIFSTSEISISSISAICSVENLLDNFFTKSVFPFNPPFAVSHHRTIRKAFCLTACKSQVFQPWFPQF